MKREKKRKVNAFALIQIIKKRPNLWNPNDEKYTDRDNTAAEWTEIASLLNEKEEVVKAKWKNLRDTFRRLSKSPKYAAGQCRWLYYRRLYFLHDVMYATDRRKRTHSESNLAPLQVEPYKEESLETENTHFLDMSSHNCSDFEVHDRSLSTNAIVKNEAMEPNSIPDEFDVASYVAGKSGDDDYDLMFLKSLLPFMKSLDPIKKLIVRNKIQDILIKEMTLQNNCQNT